MCVSGGGVKLKMGLFPVYREGGNPPQDPPLISIANIFCSTGISFFKFIL